MKIDRKGKSFQRKLSTGKVTAAKDLRKFIVFCLVLLTIFPISNPVFASTANNSYPGSKVDAGIYQEPATPTSTPMLGDSPTAAPVEVTAIVTDVPSTQTPDFTETPEPSTPTLSNTPELPTVTPIIPVEKPTSTITNTAEPPTNTSTPTFFAPTYTTTITPTPTSDDLSSQGSTTYYVSKTGSDSNPGTLSQPWKTIQKGIDKLVAGDTLYVRRGTYTETIKINNSGTSSAPIIISSYPGEIAIIDGNGLDSQLSKNTFLATILGSYIIFENFELTYPNGRGVFSGDITYTGKDSSHNIIRNLNIHHMWQQGIIVVGSYNLIEQNKIWQTDKVNSFHNDEGGWPGALNIGNSTYGHLGLNTIVRNNEVYQNYGEGILCMYTDNALIEGNRVWDNWALGIYPDQCSYTTIKNNIIYYTNDHEFWRYPTRPGDGILISNEGIIKNYPIGHNRTIFNNIIIDVGIGIDFWTGFASGSALINDVIANNTVVNNIEYGTGIDLGLPKDTNHQNTAIENNLVLVSKGGDPGYSASSEGLTFSKNLWSKKPNGSVVGAGDIVADPLLINPYQTIDLDQIAHPVKADWYLLTSSSPAIDKGMSVNEVVVDYFGNNRGTIPDMGANEYLGTLSPTNTPVTPTGTRTNTPTTPTAAKTKATSSPTATATPTSIPLPPPNLLSPSNNGIALTTRPTFVWKEVSGATSYTFQLSSSAAFSSLTANLKVSTLNYTVTSDLARNKIYYWRVKANGNKSSSWSQVISFTSANPPSVPALLSPSDNSSLASYTPILDWNNPAKSDHYQVQLATSSSFSGSSMVFDKITTPSSFTPPSPLTPNRTFFWRVRAYDLAGEYSRWSSVRHLHTRLPAPALLSPDNAGTPFTTLTFDWGDVNEATGYVIQISSHSSFTTYVVNTTVKSSSYSKNLLRGKKYFWRVLAKGTYSSKWSEVRNFIPN